MGHRGDGLPQCNATDAFAQTIDGSNEIQPGV
jgi:hypothetical protein